MFYVIMSNANFIPMLKKNMRDSLWGLQLEVKIK